MSRIILSAALILSAFVGISQTSAQAQSYWGNTSRGSHGHGYGSGYGGYGGGYGSGYGNLGYSSHSSRGYDPYHGAGSFSYPRIGNSYNMGGYGNGYGQYSAHGGHNSYYGY